MSDNFGSRLTRILKKDQVLVREPMKKHTTFRIGGPADYFVIPKTKEEIKEVIALCKKGQIPYYIIGNGSNLLVADAGYQGVIIQIYKDMSNIEIKIEAEGRFIKAQAGAPLSVIANEALRAGFAGFEFASGIPGTLGGACVMNAGAYGKEMKDVLHEVTVLTPEGEYLTLPKEKLEMGYRTSIILKKGYIVLEAVIQLEEGQIELIRGRMEELKEKRISKQPLEYPSAGSTFKRPEGYFAGKLIEDAGLRGFRVGGAMISEKHCGFAINCGDATAADVDSLMKQVSERIREKSGVTLEPEVKKLGEF